MQAIAAVENSRMATDLEITQQADYSIHVVATTSNDPNIAAERIRENCESIFRNTPINIRIVDRIEHSVDRKFKIVESRLTGAQD
jgi:hypothetical protein